MPAVSRNNDLAKTGHKCTFFVGVIASCRTVFANRIRVARPPDPLKKHTIPKPCPPAPCCINHPAVINRGSPNVFAERIPIARKFDSADLGYMVQGSRNVFANGQR
tara:strand:- start:533 stop:850 length:318 start_codon:yes stop_codon:yes gene_type:complete